PTWRRLFEVERSVEKRRPASFKLGPIPGEHPLPASFPTSPKSSSSETSYSAESVKERSPSVKSDDVLLLTSSSDRTIVHPEHLGPKTTGVEQAAREMPISQTPTLLNKRFPRDLTAPSRHRKAERRQRMGVQSVIGFQPLTGTMEALSFDAEITVPQETKAEKPVSEEAGQRTVVQK
ncbi:unnamed protein product, partial [Dicrocoelium dendriticum]